MKTFKQICRAGIHAVLFAFLFAATSCQEDVYKPGGEDELPSKESYFDFATTINMQLDIDYCLQDYAIIFEIHSEFPLVSLDDGSFRKNENVKPIYRAATDTKGVFNSEISLPAAYSKLFLYSGYLGTVQCVELAVESNRLYFNQDEYLASILTKAPVTRATTSDGNTYPDGYMVLGSWDNKGTPDYLAATRAIPADFMYRVKSTFMDNTGVKYDANYVNSSVDMDIHIIKETEVYLVFLESTGDYRNTVGYYAYDTNNPPSSPSEVTSPVIAFPSCTKITQRGAIVAGDQVQLKYWDEANGVFLDKFPAGTSIGFFLLSNAFSNGNINIGSGNNIEGITVSPDADYIFFSKNKLNQKLPAGNDLQRAIAAFDGDRMVALCFEDLPFVSIGSPYWNYNDAMFYIHVEEKDAIDDSVIPELPEKENSKPTEENNVTEYRGTLLYEDLWPFKGDYDMNDLVVYYESSVYRNPVTNKVTKVVDQLTPIAYSAGYINGFGYEFSNLSSSQIKSISGDVTSLESGQSKPTVVVSSNMKQAFMEKKTFTITTLLYDVDEKDVIPPYNPFLIVQADQQRGVEVHLTNYAPTAKVDTGLLGTEDDESQPAVGLYYVSGNDFPFALHIPNYMFYGAAEGVRIDKEYPGYNGWVTSKGANNQNWYIK